LGINLAVQKPNDGPLLINARAETIAVVSVRAVRDAGLIVAVFYE
jgi:hypothetical protein